MNCLKDFRAERLAIGASLDLFAALTPISNATLSRVERGLQKASPAMTRVILATLSNLQSLRCKFEQLSLTHCDIEWLRAEIAKMNNGKDAAEIAAAGEAADERPPSKRRKKSR